MSVPAAQLKTEKGQDLHLGNAQHFTQKDCQTYMASPDGLLTVANLQEGNPFSDTPDDERVLLPYAHKAQKTFLEVGICQSSANFNSIPAGGDRYKEMSAPSYLMTRVSTKGDKTSGGLIMQAPDNEIIHLEWINGGPRIIQSKNIKLSPGYNYYPLLIKSPAEFVRISKIAEEIITAKPVIRNTLYEVGAAVSVPPAVTNITLGYLGIPTEQQEVSALASRQKLLEAPKPQENKDNT